MQAGRSIVMILLGGILAGCHDDSPAENPSPDSSDSSSGVLESRQSPGVTVSVGSPGLRQSLPDGDVRSGMLKSDAVNNADDVAGLLGSIEQLRASIAKADTDAVAFRRERNLRIVKLATRVLKRTVPQAPDDADFVRASGLLLEARLQLAVSGAQADVEQLYADAQVLNERYPGSQPAADAIYHLARFACIRGTQSESGKVAWLMEFSRWACEFGSRFPDQQQRGASLLLAAGRSCEVAAAEDRVDTSNAKLIAAARRCFDTLLHNHDDTAEARDAVAVLRRLNLPGRMLTQFAGPAIDDTYVDVADFIGQVTVIYFWDSRNRDCVSKLLPAVRQAKADHDDVRFIGVSLDENEVDLRAFVQRNGVPGPQIFFAESGLRSWNHPLVRFWGVSRCPTVWILDRDGVVRATDVPVEYLDGQLGLLNR